MKRLTMLLGVGLLLLCAIVYALVPSVALGAVPQLINFQGILRDGSGNPVANGSYSVAFTIYDAPSGGNVFWAETTSVSTSSGLFTTLLGADNPMPNSVFNDSSRYLGVKVGADPEMTPRQKLASVAYGYRVNSVDGASGGTITSKVSIGPGHTNTGLNAFVTGASNIASGDYSAVGGGVSNTASGQRATVGGGQDNIASGDIFATVGGGSGNTASGFTGATVGGGEGNTANGFQATVGGGSLNAASSFNATVGGGLSDTASGSYSTVGGGRYNLAGGTSSTIAGGENNKARGAYAVVCGGGGTAFGAADSNAALGDYSVVGGGFRNIAGGVGVSVGGGVSNTASGDGGTVGGGVQNTASNSYATVGGGEGNVAGGDRATVPGGSSNEATGASSFAAGQRAKANHDGTFVWGDNTLENFASTGENLFLIRASGGVGIGTNAPQGALDVSSTTGAFIVPRMTTAQRNALTPVNGMIIYNTDAVAGGRFEFRENGAWVTK
ncbi:MAG: hypothetical protein L0196_07790 [candidate division Zixibacteria bacterium]|nr:hypothetical protein [candidate division Zixibacteria bacterium]